MTAQDPLALVAEAEALALASEAEASLNGTTPEPWQYDSYSRVYGNTGLTGLEWENLDDYRDRDLTAEQRRAAYEKEPLVASVPALAGDSAFDRHAVDAAFIASARTSVPALAAALRQYVERVMVLTETLTKLHDVADQMNADHMTEDDEGCMFCGATGHDGSGMAHRPECALVQARQALAQKDGA